MHLLKIAIATLAASVQLIAALPANAAPAAATAATTCALYAGQPVYNGSINGGGSWAGCPPDAKITVVLREDVRFWPDNTLRSATAHGSQGSKLLVYACGNRFDPIKVFIEVRFGSRHVQSPRSILPCA